MKELTTVIYWLFWLLVLFLFVYVATFYAWVFWRLFLDQELIAIEVSIFMNRLELGIATGILLVSVVALMIHAFSLVRRLRMVK